MSNRLINTADGEVKKLLDAGMGGLMNMQDSPLGKVNVSQKEQRKNLREIAGLPPEQQQSVIDQMKGAAGHKGNDFDDCEACRFFGQYKRKE